MLRVSRCAIALIAVSFAALAPGALAEPQHPVLSAVEVEKPPTIDGVLDDACWQSASVVEGFRFFAERRPASQPTKVCMCYDSEACYFAFYCYDDHPEQIRANETKRQSGNLFSDDWIQVGIEPTHTHASGYLFYLNPIGTQYDESPVGTAEKIEWKGDWRGAAKIVSDGWTAEFAIPFSILRYPKGQSVFAVAFCRYLARDDEEVDWPPMPGDVYDRYAECHWVNLQTPRIEHQPMVMGYATAEATPDETALHAGLDAKQFCEPDITAVASLNPDFENVENEVESIVFSYGEKYVADRRPFFMEGGGYFPGEQAFYSRRVPHFDLGAKAYGRLGYWQFGALDVWNIGDRNDSVLSCAYVPHPYRRVEAALVAADWPGVHNRVAALGYSHRVNTRQGRIGGYGSVAKSWTAGPGGDGGYQDLFVYSSPEAGYVGGSLGYVNIPKEYNPVDGYVGEGGYHGFSGRANSWYRFEGRWIRSWDWYLFGSRYLNEGGGLHHSSASATVGATTAAGTSASLGYSMDHRPPNVDRTWRFGLNWNQNVPLESGGLSLSAGKVFGGDYLYGSAWQGFRPREAWAVEVSGEYQRMALPGEPVDDAFLGMVSANLDLDPDRSLAGRYVTTAGKHNFYVSYRQVVRRGVDAYVIIGNPNVEKTEGRLALKLVYCF